MGADLYLNPPREPRVELWEQVKNQTEELRDYKKDSARLAQELKDAKAEIEQLKSTIQTMTSVQATVKKEPEIEYLKPVTFEDQLEVFLEGVREIATPENNEIHKIGFRARKGGRYVKIIQTRDGVDSSAFAFVEIETGNVLKAASWSAPAKHARGNIYNEDNGLGCVNPHGIAYLR